MKKRVLAMLIMAATVLALVPMTAGAAGQNFTEAIRASDALGVLFDQEFTMVYVEGGTFTLGWTSPGGGAPDDSAAVAGVRVSSYYIAETEVTQNLWRAVMGGAELAAAAGGNRPQTGVNWYQVQEFLSRLYVLTGKVYRLPTEAEWEFAAKGGNPGYEAGHHAYLFSGSNEQSEVAVTGGFFPANVKSRQPNILGIYDMSGNVEEWVWNAWNAIHSGGTDPTGPGGHLHNQKTRRGGYHGGTTDTSRYVAARQIRSIDGADGGLGFRIALSEDMNSVPDGMIRPRDIRHPSMDDRTIANSYRDPRWVTGDNHVWSGNFMGMMDTTMKLWETGEMVIVTNSTGLRTRTVGQWYSVNNLAVVFVSESGERITVPYVFMDYEVMTVVNDKGFFVAGAPYGRFEKVLETGAPIARPAIQNLRTPSALAAESTHDHSMYDMDNIPEQARGQDPRLFDGPEHGWHQGLGGGGTHQYRKDIDPVTGGFRFSVYQMGTGGFNNVLTRGDWFTVNDVFLRITLPNGNTADYVYAVTPAGELLHVSFMDYERGDPRVFELHANPEVVGHTNEIPMGAAQIMGRSTFRQPPSPGTSCPGCGSAIYDCACPTICQGCNSHVNHCVCSNAQTLLAQSKTAAGNAVNAITATNATIADHIMTAVQGAAAHPSIKTSWQAAFSKTAATTGAAGSVTGTVRLSLGGHTEDVVINLPIAQLPERGDFFAPGGATETTNSLTATATIASGANAGPGGLVTVRVDFNTGNSPEPGRYAINLTGTGVTSELAWTDDSGAVTLLNLPIIVTWNGEDLAAEIVMVGMNFVTPEIEPLIIEFAMPAAGVTDLTLELEFLGELDLDLPISLGTADFVTSFVSWVPPATNSEFNIPALFNVGNFGYFSIADQGEWTANDADRSGTWTTGDTLSRTIVVRADPGRKIPASVTPSDVIMTDFNADWTMTPASGWRTTRVSPAANGDLTVELLWVLGLAALTANPTESTVLVNGEVVAFDAYNINDNNYFKLRDLAYILNGTEKQFGVIWDEANETIILTSGAPYAAVGGEMEGRGAGAKTPIPTTARITMDGRDVTFTAYNIEGNNYFRLRDIGEAFDFDVTWDGASSTIVIDTSNGYTPD